MKGTLNLWGIKPGWDALHQGGHDELRNQTACLWTSNSRAYFFIDQSHQVSIFRQFYRAGGAEGRVW